MCTFLQQSLVDDDAIIRSQDQETFELNKRLAREDPAYAEALLDYPELRLGILMGDNWEQHALRMVAMYQKASAMVVEDLLFSGVLRDSGVAWAKRLVLKQTPPGPKKGQLGKEQIKWDTLESTTNRSIIRRTCGLARDYYYLP